MSFSWVIAKRYLWSKRRHPFVGIVSTISMLGILVGVAALLAVLAVMNGFDQDLRNRIIGIRAHLVMEKADAFTDAPDVMRRALAVPGVAGASPYIEGQALYQVDDFGTGILVRAVDVESEKSVTRFFSFLTEGTLSNDLNSVAIGSELAKRSKTGIGSTIKMVTQQMEKPALFKVTGIFSSGMYEFDANLIYTNLKTGQKMFAMEGSVSGVSFAADKAEHANLLKRRLLKEFGYPYDIRSWMDLNKTLFSALSLEKLVMFLILALIIFVACLNIAGSLTILVMDKTKEIGVLKAMGASSQDVMRIFAWDGLVLGLCGAALGVVAGLVICFGLKHYQWVQLPKEIYYIDRLPVSLSLRDLAVVPAVAVLLSLVSSLYPAWMAGRLDVVKALRYE